MTKDYDRFRFHQQSQKSYSDRLANAELRSHNLVIKEYYKELSINTFEQADKYKPDVSLIKQQPQLTSDYRTPLLDFLFKISKRTRVCPDIYYRSVKLLDRYCSKRIVLLEQAQLVATTCLWLVAKTDGGCNHCSPSTGGRFNGPTMRARIPRLAELCQLCGPSCSYDEGMFVQMERHILDTLNWEITEPSISEWCFNVEENNTITQLLSSREKENICLKQFIIDCSIYEHDLISTHPAELASSVIDVFTTIQSRLTPTLLLQQQQQPNQQQQRFNNISRLILPSINIDITEKLLIAITKASETLISNYSNSTSPEFIKNYIQQSHYYLISIQKSKKRSLSETSVSSSFSNGGNSTNYYDSEEDSSDNDSLFDHIVNHSMSLSGSRTPSPLPSPDKFMFNNMIKRQHTGNSQYNSSGSPFGKPRRIHV